MHHIMKIRESNEPETLQRYLAEMSPVSLQEPKPKNNLGGVTIIWQWGRILSQVVNWEESNAN